MSQYMKACISNKLIEVTHQSYLPPAVRTSHGGRKPFSYQTRENYQANASGVLRSKSEDC